jgi:hypothetical protein
MLLISGRHHDIGAWATDRSITVERQVAAQMGVTTRSRWSAFDYGDAGEAFFE